MFFKKTGFPEDGELVLCTVTSVQFHSVFVTLDEYGRGGMIHISEVSPGRIRNIRDFVKEGKKVVCKVLKINEEKGHIDLSLRRVNESERRKKVERIKKEQNAEKIIEFMADKLSLKKEEFYKAIADKVFRKYQYLSESFEEFVNGKIKLEEIGIPSKYAEPLSEMITQRMKPQEVSIKGKMKIITYAPDGIRIIKNSLKKMLDTGKKSMSISYLGSGNYLITVTSSEYKEAEKTLKEGVEAATEIIEEHDGFVEFARV